MNPASRDKLFSQFAQSGPSRTDEAPSEVWPHLWGTGLKVDRFAPCIELTKEIDITACPMELIFPFQIYHPDMASLRNRIPARFRKRIEEFGK